MLARIGSELDLDREGVVFEPKLDGIRAVCRKSGDRLMLFNRSCVDISDRYAEFDFAEAIAADSVVLDGEIVLYDSAGQPDFSGLMKHHLRGVSGSRRANRSLRYAVFDVLEKEGENLCRRPLSERKEILDATVDRAPHLEKTIFTTEGRKFWGLVIERNLEGVIAKQIDGIYEPGRRTRSWLKIKAFHTIDCVIVGFSSDKRPVSSLGVALYDEGDRLQFIGKVGTGFSDADIRRLRELLEPLTVSDAPAEGVPGSYRDLQWVRPAHVCELRFLEIGSQGMMRNPSFLRLRDDKPPEACRMDQVAQAS